MGGIIMKKKLEWRVSTCIYILGCKKLDEVMILSYQKSDIDYVVAEGNVFWIWCVNSDCPILWCFNNEGLKGQETF